MKRDMDLIREILLKAEGLPDANGHPIEVAGYARMQVYEHARLASAARLIDARFMVGTDEFAVLRLTWDGHDFLESARHATFWGRWKSRVVDVGLPLTIEGMKAVLPEVLKLAARGR